MPKKRTFEISPLPFELAASLEALGQRIALARAAYGNPSLVVLDEPNANLDDQGEAALVTAIAGLKQAGCTVVLITHDNSIAVQAERIIRLEDGVVVYDGDAHAPEAVVQPNLMMSAPKAGEEGAHA